MKHFGSLTPGGQVRRLKRLAQEALDRYGLSGARVEPITHFENTTFRVIVAEQQKERLSDERFEPGSYLLRLHRPGYHTAEQIGSELMWLDALYRDTDLSVAIPVRSREGAPLVEVSHPHVPRPRVVSMLRWMPGKRFSRAPAAWRIEAMGAMTARLHNHAAGWEAPVGFVRRRWDAGGLFVEPEGVPSEMWGEVEPRLREICLEAMERCRGVMDELGDGPEVFGLLHADLHLSNVLFDGRVIRPIDFDDCGYAHWLYDLAVTLSYLLRRPDYLGRRQALLRGYRAHRPLSGEHEALLDTFIVARFVMMVLWLVERAGDHQGLAEVLPSYSERTSRVLQAWLRKEPLHEVS